MGSSPAAAAVAGNSSPPVAGAAGNCTRWAALPVDPVINDDTNLVVGFFAATLV